MIEVKPTLAGLAEALNTLLANGADPNAEVMCGVFEDVDTGQLGTEIFDGLVDTETIEQAEAMGARTRLRIVISSSTDYEVREELAKELPPLEPPLGPQAAYPNEDFPSLAADLRSPRPFGELSPPDYARLAAEATTSK